MDRFGFVLPIILLATPVNAGFLGNNITPFVSVGRQYDSNVFRLSSDEDPNIVIDNDKTSEVIDSKTVGVNVNLPLGQQLLELKWQVTDNDYHRFDFLDHSNRSLQLGWKWQAGATGWKGNLRAIKKRELSSFDDIGLQILDFRETSIIFASAEHRLFDRINLGLSIQGKKVEHSETTREVNNLDEQLLAARITYKTPANNQIFIESSFLDGDFGDRVLSAVNDTGFQQKTLAIGTLFNLATKTTFEAKIGRIWHTFDNLSDGDFQESTGQLKIQWAANKKTDVNFAANRSVNQLNNADASFVVQNIYSMEANWRITEKMTLSPSLSYVDRFSDNRDDDIKRLSLDYEYRIKDNVSLSLSYQYEERDSNQVLSDYRFYNVLGSVKVSF